MDNQILTKQQAREYLGLDSKVFDNYFQTAGEFAPLPRLNNRGKFHFDSTLLQQWKESYSWRTLSLTRDDYNLCLDFALAMHFRGYVLSDWGSARQREFGQKLTNWIKGQLAEVAVKRFIFNNFNVEVGLDFQLHSEIVPQDIIAIMGQGTVRLPKLGVSIKSSKPKSAYLVLGGNEIDITTRSSDVYILCRPDLPDDHLLRIARSEIMESIKDQPHHAMYRRDIPEFSDIPCEIAGFCYKSDLEKVTEIPGQVFDNGYRYVKQSGKLRRSRQDWQELVSKL